MGSTVSGGVTVSASVLESLSSGFKSPGPIASTILEVQTVPASALVYSAQRTLSGSSSETLDLAGVLADSYGNTLTFAHVNGIVIRNRGANVVKIGPNSSNGFGASNGPWNASADRSTANPANGSNFGTFTWLDPGSGATVTAGTGDLLYVQNTAAGSITYDVLIWGS